VGIDRAHIEGGGKLLWRQKKREGAQVASVLRGEGGTGPLLWEEEKKNDLFLKEERGKRGDRAF